MTEIEQIFHDLATVIGRYGHGTRLANEVKAAFASLDVVVFDNTDGHSVEVDFGVRKGGRQITGCFSVRTYPSLVVTSYRLDLETTAEHRGANLEWEWRFDVVGDELVPDGVDRNQLCFPEFQ